jgi:predicted aspartyl protease
MPVKSFEHVIPFTQARGEGWLPIVSVGFISSNGSEYELPLLFDTGATEIILPPEFVEDFPPGEPAQANVGGAKQPAIGILTNATVEFMGHRMKCEILLLDLPANPLRAGLFGRGCFKPFGFGFWESTRELYVTSEP